LKTQLEQRPQIRMEQVLTTDGTIGISATGKLYRETLHEILYAIPSSGTFELVCHPGYNDSDLELITTRLRTHRDIERNALLTEVPALALHPNPHTESVLSSGNLVEQTQVGNLRSPESL